MLTDDSDNKPAAAQESHRGGPRFHTLSTVMEIQFISSSFNQSMFKHRINGLPKNGFGY